MFSLFLLWLRRFAILQRGIFCLKESIRSATWIRLHVQFQKKMKLCQFAFFRCHYFSFHLLSSQPWCGWIWGQLCSFLFQVVMTCRISVSWMFCGLSFWILFKVAMTRYVWGKVLGRNSTQTLLFYILFVQDIKSSYFVWCVKSSSHKCVKRSKSNFLCALLPF